MRSWALGAAVGLVSMVLFDSVWPSVALTLGIGLVGVGLSYTWPRFHGRR
ncbi:hypothetical protein [Cellulomonas soli]